MPSSLIFAGLAAAWLVVLVPMVAKRRQEVIRTADSALASRVLHRSAPARSRADHDEELAVMTEQRPPWDSGPDDDDLHRRPYRPGRGGFDPEAAALAARARYAFRQQVVIGLLVITVASVALAFIVSSTAWWAVVGALGALVGYLAYLRRQVHIEEEVRRRRAARLSAVTARRAAEVRDEDDSDDYDGEDDHGEDGVEDQQDTREEAVVRRAVMTPPPPVHPRAVVVDLDDEDPAFAELDPTFEPSYRRAVGE